MAMVSSTEGSPTKTGWKRRSSAASFSMDVRYSSSVVAPIRRSSPRASIGLIIWPASIAPSAAPAPTRVCSSSMKVTISPSDSVISLSTALRRSSNSPRYLAPATMEPRSSAIDALALEALGHVALDDAVGQPLDDGRLAHAGLADEHGVVLRPARQHLDHPADLLVAPDDRVELALAGRLGQVPAVLGQRLVGLLGVLRGHPVVAPHRPQRGEQVLARHADLVGQGQDEVLDRHVVVAQVAPELVRRLEHGPRLAREPGLGPALGLGQPDQLVVHLARQLVGIHPDLGQQRAGQRVLLLEQRVEQVGRRQLRVVGGGGVARGCTEGGPGVVRPAFWVYRHSISLFVFFVLVFLSRSSSSSFSTAPSPAPCAPGSALPDRR